MSSISSQALADSALGLSKPVCEQLDSVKSTPSVMPSCTSTGPTSPSTTTSASSTASPIGKQLNLFAADTPASPFQSQESNAAQRMKGISGLKCLELYEKSGRDGSLPRTLLGMLNKVSTRLPHRWKLKTSPSGRLLFQLQPLTRHTGGTDSGLLPTPMAVMRGRPEIAFQQALKGEPLYKRRDKDGNGRQFSIVDYLIYHSSLPTPMASDCKGATDNCARIKNQELSYLRYCLHFHLKPPSMTSYPHPSFVERMMGYPIGHTDLGGLETRSFRKSSRSLDAPLLNWINNANRIPNRSSNHTPNPIPNPSEGEIL